MAQVILEGLTKVYRSRREEVRAVTDLTLTVAHEEMMVLVGPSGCGKTTTLRLIAGLEAATAGAIRIDDRVVNDVPPRDRNVALVSQNFALYPHMSVGKNLAFPLHVRGVNRREIRERVLKVARQLGIDHLLDRRPAEISGGERQRAALGRALVREPRVFLFDEPLAHLDAPLKARLREEIRTFHFAQPTAMLYVTHDQEEAMSLGDRMAVLRNGALQQIGTPWEVYHRPANRFVGEFIGSPRMNVVEGRYDRDSHTVAMNGGNVSLIIPTAFRALLERHHGSPIALGWRAEDLHLAPDNASGADAPAAISATAAGKQLTLLQPMRVRDVEPAGDRANVHLVGSAGEVFTVRTPADAEHSRGAVVRVFADMVRVHVFEAGEAGTRLNRPEPAEPS